MIYIDIGSLLVNVVHLRFTFTLSLYKHIFLYIPATHHFGKISLGSKPPLQPPSLSVFWSVTSYGPGCLETVKISQTKELNPSELNLGGLFFPHFFFLPGAMGFITIFNHHLGESKSTVAHGQFRR